MLKKLLTSVVACSAVALVLPGSASAAVFCDNFGREWDITLTTCADADTGKCASGSRDINDELGCGPAPVFGTLVSGVLTVSSLDDPDDTCVTVAWRGSYNGVAVDGSFQSEGGGTGTFTLGPCSNAAPHDNNETIGADPQAHR